MYHAQEKIVNVPGAETSKKRGGIHNSVTRAVTKPTHMIGGYAQLSYGFNYYGTVGSNRDEFVVVRKMHEVNWMEGPRDESRPNGDEGLARSPKATGRSQARPQGTEEVREPALARTPAPKGA
jgi:nitrate reductase alpha subunit